MPEEATQDLVESVQDLDALDAELDNFQLDDEPASTPEPQVEAEPAETPGVVPEQEQEAEPEATPQPQYVGWDQVLPDDPALPKTYRGQKTVGDLWQERTELTQQQHRSNQILNEQTQRLNHLQSTLEVLQKRWNEMQVPQPKAPEPRRSITEELGLNVERELVNDAGGVLNRISDATRERTAQELREEFEGKISDLTSRLQTMDAKEKTKAMYNASEAAFGNLVSRGAQVDPQFWASRRTALMATIYENAESMDAFYDPRWWVGAFEHIYGAPQPPPQAETGEASTPEQIKTPQSATSNAKPAGGRAVTRKRLPDNLRKENAEIAALFGLDADQLEEEIVKEQMTRRGR